MCVLTVVSLMKSSRPISAFERPLRDQAEHVAARASVSSSSSVRRRRARDARELPDHAPRDGRREQRVAGGDGADRGEQLLGRVVLEHEAARAGAQRLVDVLVEVERRQDQDPRGCRRRRGSAASPRGRRARACGCPSARRRAEARGLLDRLEPVARLGDDLDVRLAREQHPEAGADHRLVVGDEDADRHRAGRRRAGAAC